MRIAARNDRTAGREEKLKIEKKTTTAFFDSSLGKRTLPCHDQTHARVCTIAVCTSRSLFSPTRCRYHRRISCTRIYSNFYGSVESTWCVFIFSKMSECIILPISLRNFILYTVFVLDLKIISCLTKQNIVIIFITSCTLIPLYFKFPCVTVWKNTYIWIFTHETYNSIYKYINIFYSIIISFLFWRKSAYDNHLSCILLKSYLQCNYGCM